MGCGLDGLLTSLYSAPSRAVHPGAPEELCSSGLYRQKHLMPGVEPNLPAARQLLAGPTLWAIFVLCGSTFSALILLG